MTPKEKRPLTLAAAVDRLEEASAGSGAALNRALDRHLSRRSRAISRDDRAMEPLACREAFGARAPWASSACVRSAHV
jgi:hypothetical protein